MFVKQRVFAYDGREFPDPDPTLPVDEVRKIMANFFPELANAESNLVSKPDRPDVEIWEFKSKVGRKGYVDALTPSMIAACLQNVPETHLNLIDLAWTCSDGKELDDDKCNLHRKEIEAAVAQATSYVRSCRNLSKRLARLIVLD